MWLPGEGENSAQRRKVPVFLCFYLSSVWIQNIYTIRAGKPEQGVGVPALSSVSDSCIPQPAHPTPHCHHAKLAYDSPCSCLTLSLWPNSFMPIYGHRLSSSHAISVLPSGIYLLSCFNIYYLVCVVASWLWHLRSFLVVRGLLQL